MHDINDLMQLIANTLRIDMGTISINNRLQELQHWDSLSALRVLNAIEQQLAIKLPLYAFLRLSTISELYQLTKES